MLFFLYIVLQGVFSELQKEKVMKNMPGGLGDTLGAYESLIFMEALI